MATSKQSIVYRAANATNGKQYIGVTKRSLDRRKAEHARHAARGSRYAFHRAIKKHGIGSFCFDVIASFSDHSDALKHEMEMIRVCAPAYNMTAGGEGVSRIWTQEQREKMRLRKLTNPTRYWLGKKRDKATIDKIRATKAFSLTPQICIEVLGKHRAEAIKIAASMRRKKVVCLNDGTVFSCARDAANFYGISSYRLLYNAIRRRTAIRGKGLRFAYDGGG